MVEIHDVKQGTREWFALRIGTPTVSNLPRILTPAKLKISAGAKTYAAELVAERILGEPLDHELATEWTARGTELESEARDWYAMYRDVEVDEVGFVTIAGGAFGGSPDGLVGDDGLVEIKCRSAKMHARIITGVDEAASRLQTQGYLWLTGREWIDVLAYTPPSMISGKGLPKHIQRQYRDPTVHQAIETAVTDFIEMIDEGLARLKDLGEVIEEGNDDITRKLRESLAAGATT